MMKLLLMAGLVAVAGCHHGSSDGHEIGGRTAYVRIVRPGEMGALNIVPCTVELSNYQKLILLGEQEAAVRVEPGIYTVSVHSIDYYNRGTNEMAWASPPLQVDLHDSDCITLEITDNDHRGWLIKKK